MESMASCGANRAVIIEHVRRPDTSMIHLMFATTKAMGS
jgi:hypothetical protein